MSKEHCLDPAASLQEIELLEEEEVAMNAQHVPGTRKRDSLDTSVKQDLKSKSLAPRRTRQSEQGVRQEETIKTMWRDDADLRQSERRQDSCVGNGVE